MLNETIFMGGIPGKNKKAMLADLSLHHQCGVQNPAWARATRESQGCWNCGRKPGLEACVSPERSRPSYAVNARLFHA
jgi:hypothetical protein